MARKTNTETTAAKEKKVTAPNSKATEKKAKAVADSTPSNTAELIAPANITSDVVVVDTPSAKDTPSDTVTALIKNYEARTVSADGAYEYIAKFRVGTELHSVPLRGKIGAIANTIANIKSVDCTSRYALCRSLSALRACNEEIAGMNIKGLNDFASFAEKTFGIKRATATLYADIGKFFITDNFKAKFFLDGYSTGVLQELLPAIKYFDKAYGVEYESYFEAYIKSLKDGNKLTPYTSTKGLRDEVKIFLASKGVQAKPKTKAITTDETTTEKDATADYNPTEKEKFTKAMELLNDLKQLVLDNSTSAALSTIEAAIKSKLADILK